MVALKDVPGEDVSEAALRYANRLSDFLFVRVALRQCQEYRRRAVGAPWPIARSRAEPAAIVHVHAPTTPRCGSSGSSWSTVALIAVNSGLVLLCSHLVLAAPGKPSSQLASRDHSGGAPSPGGAAWPAPDHDARAADARRPICSSMHRLVSSPEQRAVRSRVFGDNVEDAYGHCRLYLDHLPVLRRRGWLHPHADVPFGMR